MYMLFHKAVYTQSLDTLPRQFNHSIGLSFTGYLYADKGIDAYYEYTFPNKIEFIASAGFLFENYNSNKTRGLRTRLGMRYLIRNMKNYSGFIGLMTQYNILRDKYWAYLYHYQGNYYEEKLISQTRNKLGLLFITGAKFYLSLRYTLEYFFGIGSGSTKITSDLKSEVSQHDPDRSRLGEPLNFMYSLEIIACYRL